MGEGVNEEPSQRQDLLLARKLFSWREARNIVGIYLLLCPTPTSAGKKKIGGGWQQIEGDLDWPALSVWALQGPLPISQHPKPGDALVEGSASGI